MRQSNRKDQTDKKRADIKQKAQAMLDRTRREANRAQRMAEQRMAKSRQQREDAWEAIREKQLLAARDREDKVKMQRRALLHQQATAKRRHEEWQRHYWESCRRPSVLRGNSIRKTPDMRNGSENRIPCY